MSRKKKDYSIAEKSKNIKELQNDVSELKEETQNLQKEIYSKTKSKKLGLVIGISTTILALASIITPLTIMIINNNKTNINRYVFNDNDINYLRSNLQSDVVDNKLDINSFKLHIFDYFKTFLKASNINISKLILNVEVVSSFVKYIEFKVTLSSDNSEYLYQGNSLDVKLTSNTLEIIFQGSSAIDFY